MTGPEVTAAVTRAAEALEDASWRLIERDMGTIYRNDIARETVAAALGSDDLEVCLFVHSLRTDMRCSCGRHAANEADHANHQAAMIRAELIGEGS